MGIDMTKPIFRVSDEVKQKPACSATETNTNNEISLVASFEMILSDKRITEALIRLCGCTGWTAPLLFRNQQRQFFSRRDPYYSRVRSDLYQVHVLKKLKRRKKTCCRIFLYLINHKGIYWVFFHDFFVSNWHFSKLTFQKILSGTL